VFNNDVKLMKAPAMMFEEVTPDIVGAIQIWYETLAAIINWKNYRGLAIVDIENIYLLLYSLKDDRLSNCFILNFNEVWLMEEDREETWDRVRNIIKLLGIKESIDVGEDWQ
jgi:hypothetical protein